MKNILFTKFLILFFGILVVIILHISGIQCIFRHFTGIICPGCGMTRAILSCLAFNIKSAFSYHAMVFSLPVLFLYFLKDGKVFKRQLINNVVLTLIGTGFLINYLYKLFIYY